MINIRAAQRCPAPRLIFSILTLLLCGGLHAQWVWQPQFHTGNRLRDVRLTPDGRGMAIGDGNVLLCTTNGGETWTGTGSADPDLTTASLVGTSFYFGNREGGIFVLNNPGTCLSEPIAIATPALSNLTDLHMVSNSTGYAAANGIIRFTNNEWSSSTAVVNFDCPTDAQALWFLSAELGVAVSNSGQITRIRQDSGTFLCEIVASTGQALSNVHFANGQYGYAVGDAGTVLASADSGQTWQIRSLPEEDDLTAVFATGSLTVHAAGDQLYRSTDGGMVWERLSKPSPMTQAEALWFIDANNGWVAGANGFLGYTGNAGGSGVALYAQQLDQTATEWTLGPNPANHALQVWMNTPQPTDWSLWNSQGTLVNFGIWRGAATVSLDELPDGLYWIKAGPGPAKSFVVARTGGVR